MTTRIDVPGHGSLTLPPHLLANLRAVHGDRLEPWLESLPRTLETVLGTLDAVVVPGEPGLSYHLVCFAERANGDQIAIKATVPNDEQPPEVAGVEALASAGIGPRLLWADLDLGVIAMERVVPGTLLPTHLPTLAEDAVIIGRIGALAARIAGEIDPAPWRDRLLPVREYTRALHTYDPTSALWRDHRDEVARARALRDALLADPHPPHGVVHGDLHHYNVLLDAEGDARVIDPKGLLGPIGYDFGVMTYDPMDIRRHPDLPALYQQRVTVWSNATNLPWEEVRDWGYIGGMVSACWDSEGGSDGWRDTLRGALLMRDLTPPR